MHHPAYTTTLPGRREFTQKNISGHINIFCPCHLLILKKPPAMPGVQIYKR